MRFMSASEEAHGRRKSCGRLYLWWAGSFVEVPSQVWLGWLH
jgi:hypothetical protein